MEHKGEAAVESLQVRERPALPAMLPRSVHFTLCAGRTVEAVGRDVGW